MCCVKCCIWCLEKIVAFINKNAYIMIGLKGSNYCSAAGRAIQLLISVRGLKRLKHCHPAAPLALWHSCPHELRSMCSTLS